jgi:hypothetical protein
MGSQSRRLLAVASVRTSRRGHGKDSIYFDAEKNRYVGAVSLGHGGDGTRVRRKVYGKTKQDVRLKLKTLRSDIEAGTRAPASYTVPGSGRRLAGRGIIGTVGADSHAVPRWSEAADRPARCPAAAPAPTNQRGARRRMGAPAGRSPGDIPHRACPWPTWADGRVMANCEVLMLVSQIDGPRSEEDLQRAARRYSTRDCQDFVR